MNNSELRGPNQSDTAWKLHEFYQYYLKLIEEYPKHFAIENFPNDHNLADNNRPSRHMYPSTSSFYHLAYEICDRFVKIRVKRKDGQKLAFFASYRLKFVQITEMGFKDTFMLPEQLFQDTEIQVFLVIREKFNWYIRKMEFPDIQMVVPGTIHDLKMLMWDYNKQQLFNYESSVNVQIYFDSLFYTQPFRLLASFGPNLGDIKLATALDGEPPANDLYDYQVFYHLYKHLKDAPASLREYIAKYDVDYSGAAHLLPNFWIYLSYQGALTFRRYFVNYYYVNVDMQATVCVKDKHTGELIACIEQNGKLVSKVQCEYQTLIIHIPMNQICDRTFILHIETKDECVDYYLNFFWSKGIQLYLPLMFEGYITQQCSVYLDSTVLTSHFSLHSYYETVWTVMQILDDTKEAASNYDLYISKRLIKDLVDILRERVMSKPIYYLLYNLGIHIYILFSILKRVSQNDYKYEQKIRQLLGDDSYSIAEGSGDDSSNEFYQMPPARRIIFNIILIVFEFAQQYCRNIGREEEVFYQFTYFQYQAEVLKRAEIPYVLPPCMGYKFEQPFNNSTIGRLVSNYITLDYEFTELYIDGLDYQLLRNIRMLKSGSYYLDILYLSLANGNNITFEQAHSLFTTLGRQLALFAGILAEKLSIKRQSISTDTQQMIDVSASLYKIFHKCEATMSYAEVGNLFRGLMYQLQYVDSTDEQSIQTLTTQLIVKSVVIPFITYFLAANYYVSGIEEFISDLLTQCLSYELSQSAPEIAVLFYFYYYFLAEHQSAHVQTFFTLLTDNIGQFLQVPQTMDYYYWGVIYRTFFAVYLEMLSLSLNYRAYYLADTLKKYYIAAVQFLSRLFELFDFVNTPRQGNYNYYYYYYFCRHYLTLYKIPAAQHPGELLANAFLGQALDMDPPWDMDFALKLQDEMYALLLMVLQLFIGNGGLAFMDLIAVTEKFKLTAHTEPISLAIVQSTLQRNAPEEHVIYAALSIQWRTVGVCFAVDALDGLIKAWETAHRDINVVSALVFRNCPVKNTDFALTTIKLLDNSTQYKRELIQAISQKLNYRQNGSVTSSLLTTSNLDVFQFDELTQILVDNIKSQHYYSGLEQLAVILQRHQNYYEAANVNQVQIRACLSTVHPQTYFERQLEYLLNGCFLHFAIPEIAQQATSAKLAGLVYHYFNLLTLAYNLEMSTYFLQILLNNNYYLRIYSPSYYRQTSQLLQRYKKQVVAEQLYSQRQFGYFYRVRFLGYAFGSLDYQSYVMSRSVAHRCFDVYKELQDYYQPRIDTLQFSTYFSPPQTAQDGALISLFSLQSYVPEHFKNPIFQDLLAYLKDSCARFGITLPYLCYNPAKSLLQQQVFYSERNQQQGMFTARTLRFTLSANQLPALCTRSEVLYEFTYQLTPVQSAVLQFAQQLHSIKRQIYLHHFYVLNDLQMSLQGVAAANVNGGPVHLTEQLIESGKFGYRDICCLVKELKLLADATGDLLKLCDQIPKQLQEFQYMLQKAVGILRGKANVLWDYYKAQPI